MCTAVNAMMSVRHKYKNKKKNKQTNKQTNKHLLRRTSETFLKFTLEMRRSRIYRRPVVRQDRLVGVMRNVYLSLLSIYL